MFFPAMLVFMCVAHGHPSGTAHNHFHESPPAKVRASSKSNHASQSEELSSAQSHFPEAAWVANQFLMHLLRKNWDAMLELAAFPFWLESKTFPSPQALREEWEKQLSQKHLDDYEVRGIEVLTLEQMKARFGPPPERLGKLLQGRNTHLFAIANVSRRAVVLLLQPPSRDATFKVVAFHD